MADLIARNAELSMWTNCPSWAKSLHISVKWWRSSSCADPQDPVATVAVAELAAERVAGVGRVGDQRVVAQRLDDLGDQPRLRVDRVEVEVARHGEPRPLRGLGGGLEVAAELLGEREDQRLLGGVHGLGVGVAALGEERQHPVDELLGHAGAAGDADVAAPRRARPRRSRWRRRRGTPSRAPASRATSTRRTELDELPEPTTITRSASRAISLIASCRFWVA